MNNNNERVAMVTSLINKMADGGVLDAVSVVISSEEQPTVDIPVLAQEEQVSGIDIKDSSSVIREGGRGENEGHLSDVSDTGWDTDLEMEGTLCVCV